MCLLIRKLQATGFVHIQNAYTQTNQMWYFKKICGCANHDHENSASSPLFKIAGKKLKSAKKQWLLEHKLINHFTIYICQNCIQNTDDQYIMSSAIDSEVITADSGSKLCAEEKPMIAQSEFTPDDTHCITAHILKLVSADISSLYKAQSMRNIDNVANSDPSEWLKNRPIELVSLVCGLCNVEDCNTSLISIVAKIVELIYFCHNSKLVLPVSFTEAMFGYSMTNSKALVTMLSKLQPCGTYNNICKWLKEDEAPNEVVTPEGVNKNVIDTNQKIVDHDHTYAISGDNTVPIPTSHITIEYDSEEDAMQEKCELKPSTRMFGELNQHDKSNVIKHMTRQGPIYHDTHDVLIKNAIQRVSDEHKTCDYADECIKRRYGGKTVCFKCGLQNHPNTRKCCFCQEMSLVFLDFDEPALLANNSYEVCPGIFNTDIETLNDGELLNDVIINRYMEIVTKYWKRYIYFDSFLYEDIKRRYSPGLQVNWSTIEAALIPVCLSSHWMLLCFRPKQSKMQMYNSMKVSVEEMECAKTLATYFGASGRGRKRKVSIQVIKEAPLQVNAYDCGIYTCMFARCVVYGNSLQFDPNQVRGYRDWMKQEIYAGEIKMSLS